MLGSRIIIPLALVAALVCLCLTAGTAAAAKPTKSSGCPAVTDLRQVFKERYRDPAFYYLAPQGNFERSAWSGGDRVSDNEPDFVGSTTDTGSMRLGGRGSTAVSPSVCIGLDEPTIRFYVKRVSGLPLAPPLGVALRYTGTDRRTYEIPVGTVPSPPLGEWSVTLPVPLILNFAVPIQALGTAPHDPTLETSTVRLVLTAPAGTTWHVDDIYVDPYSRG